MLNRLPGSSANKSVLNIFFVPTHGRMHITQMVAPMNEPAGFASSALLSAARQYWFDSYSNIRQSGTAVVEVIHDAFKDLSYWSGVMPSSRYQNVMMDTHHYEIFSNDQVAMTYQQHITVSYFFTLFSFRGCFVFCWILARGGRKAELHVMLFFGFPVLGSVQSGECNRLVGKYSRKPLDRCGRMGHYTGGFLHVCVVLLPNSNISCPMLVFITHNILIIINHICIHSTTVPSTSMAVALGHGGTDRTPVHPAMAPARRTPVQ